MNIVLDAGVLVSALWSPSSKPTAILNAVISRKFTACYNYRTLGEYNKVQRRPKFGFSEWEIICLLEPIIKNGISVIAEPLPKILFTDDSDKKFYEVAKFATLRLSLKIQSIIHRIAALPRLLISISFISKQ